MIIRRLFRYLVSPKVVNENWTNRVPKTFVVGFTGSNQQNVVSLLQKTFDEADIIENDSENANQSDLMAQNLSKIYDNKNSQMFIQEFPFNYENALEYENKTNGINLFINFCGMIYINISSLFRIC